ncbi:hypothetical protein Dsin_024188 [Dipteronia sinensis]|uniref:Endonuclease/exonuclease/phosphatase domain-containing protein n=1 Tax=Dipteronia sinensis TaxID=43782 RepID=A0AAE0A4S5_9ROSI|nr:hypothetical protein Dsin_024188 [Dipteronia sinensis]
MPWCIGGDFNTVLHPSERKGGICNMSSVNSLNAFVLQARVVDLPLTGHLGSLSDHSAVSIGEPQTDWGPCPFRFYNGWLEDKVMMNDVMSGWRRNRASSSVLEREMRLAEVEKQALRVGWGEELRQKRATIIQQHWKYIRLEEQIWRQKSRVKWLKDGDKNSRRRISWRLSSVLRRLGPQCLDADRNKAPGQDGFNLKFIQSNWEAFARIYALSQAKDGRMKKYGMWNDFQMATPQGVRTSLLTRWPSRVQGTVEISCNLWTSDVPISCLSVFCAFFFLSPLVPLALVGAVLVGTWLPLASCFPSLPLGL